MRNEKLSNDNLLQQPILYFYLLSIKYIYFIFRHLSGEFHRSTSFPTTPELYFKKQPTNVQSSSI